MKYPSAQFELLTKALSILNTRFENVDKINASHLHYLVYQQSSPGQEHNALFINENGHIAKGYYISGLGLPGYKKLIDFLTEDNFALYPPGCNDSHIETAVKKALSVIKQ